ncbi:MAG: phosphatase PAP2 family protein, partial [Thermoleophilia bacterium]|nr:phosphatase PAP2 family protein [Thermoleophilia bacterium]
MRAGGKPGFSRPRETAIGLGVYAAYLLVRQIKLRRGARARAARNADRLVALERRLGLHVEPALQRALLPRTRLVAVLNVAYVTLNVGLTVGWLIRLFRRRDAEFHPLRRAAV